MPGTAMQPAPWYPPRPAAPGPSIAKPVLIALSIAVALLVLGVVGLVALAALVPSKKQTAAPAAAPTHAPRR